MEHIFARRRANAETWINEGLCIPSVQGDRRPFYPYSKGWALVYRLKLALVLLNAAFAIAWPEAPCNRFGLLLHCWLLFVVCNFALMSYPWKEPLTTWAWRLHWAIPFSRVLLVVCCVPLLLAALYVGADCDMAHPSMAALFCWLCCLFFWPELSARWRRGPPQDGDYDQFSCCRPYVLTIRSSWGRALWMMREAMRPSFEYPALFCVVLATFTLLLFAVLLSVLLGQGLAHSGSLLHHTQKLAALALAVLSLGVVACIWSYLPADADRVSAEWERQTAAHLRRVENHLRSVKHNLQIGGRPVEGTPRFDQLAVHVPLLMREVKIIKNSGRVEARVTSELDNLAASPEVVAFRERLPGYGPYTTRCCIS